MKTAASTRARLTGDAIRAGLTELGLREEFEPINGYAFTYRKHPTAAKDFYRETHGGAEARRFYLHPRMFVLSD